MKGPGLEEREKRASCVLERRAEREGGGGGGRGGLDSEISYIFSTHNK